MRAPAQGWSICHHTLSRGNAEVSHILLDSLQKECGVVGLIAAVPFSMATRVKITQHQVGALSIITHHITSHHHTTLYFTTSLVMGCLRCEPAESMA